MANYYYAVCPVCKHTYQPATQIEMESVLLHFNSELRYAYDCLIRMEKLARNARTTNTQQKKEGA